MSSGLKRFNNEITDLDLPRNAKIDFFNKKDISDFRVKIRPTDESLWFRGEYLFRIKIGENYPHTPPDVKCETKVCFAYRLLSFTIDISP